METDAQDTQDFILGKPSWGWKTQQAFSFRVSSYNVNTCLGMPPAKSSEGEGNVPRARTYQPTEKLFTRCAITKDTSALPRGEMNHQSVNEWMRSDSLLYLYMTNHKASNRVDNKNNIIMIHYNEIYIDKTLTLASRWHVVHSKEKVSSSQPLSYQ